MSSKKIAIVCHNFPPFTSGVADHTHLLGEALQKSNSVIVLTAYQKKYETTSLKVIPCFDKSKPWTLMRLWDIVRQNRVDQLLLQYDPFAYGSNYGINPFIIWGMRRIRTILPSIKIGLIVHETFIPRKDFKRHLLSNYLVWQLRKVIDVTDVVFTPVESWAKIIQNWFPDKTVIHLPVGSNLPIFPTDSVSEKQRFSISPDQIVLGMFGRIRRVPNIELVRVSIEKLQKEKFNPLLFYVGLEAMYASEAFAGLPYLAHGPLSGEEISRRFHAMDIFLCPVEEGISCRRGTLAAAVQHGLPVVATWGEITDNLLRQLDGDAFLLAENTSPSLFADQVFQLASNFQLRQKIKKGAETYAAQIAWPALAELVSHAM